MPHAPLKNPVIVAERMIPGFSRDLSTWTFSVGADGAAVQEVDSAFPQSRKRDRARVFTCHVAAGEVAAILAAAEAGGFELYAPHYTIGVADDCESTALSFRVGGGLKRVETLGAWLLARDGSTEMKTFCLLWDRVVRLLPFGGESRSDQRS